VSDTKDAPTPTRYQLRREIDASPVMVPRPDGAWVLYEDACNSHDALVAALEKLRDQVEFMRTMGNITGGSHRAREDLDEAFATANAALKAARGES